MSSLSSSDKRLIEDYIPIKAISAEASREKSIRQGHISTLHLWWARRPLVACRAAVFAALVPADAKPQIIDAQTKAPMTMTKFMIELCKWKVTGEFLDEARRLIREAYPDHPPKVLDMFAGGGSIPLEALRLGCEAYALDLNPVAHIIELATLVYPQKYGPQLAEDVRKWGEWVLERVRAEVGDLYPLIPDPAYTQETADFLTALGTQPRLLPYTKGEQMPLGYVAESNGEADSGPEDDEGVSEGTDDDADVLPGRSEAIPPGSLQPVAYLWTRTVTCPNPSCRATVPLVRQTWLKKKKGDNVALEMKPHPTENRMAFHVRHSTGDFNFDPAGFSQRGNSVCGRCGTTVTSDYVKAEGKAGRMGAQMMATVCVRSSAKGKVYLSPDDVELLLPDAQAIQARIEALAEETGITPPDEEIFAGDSRAFFTHLYGITHFEDLFSPRQLLTTLTFAAKVRSVYVELLHQGTDAEYARVVTAYLALTLDRLITNMSTQSRWRSDAGERVVGAFSRQALPMVWDYAELMPFNSVFTSWPMVLRVGLDVILHAMQVPTGADVRRGSAVETAYDTEHFDAIVTDPPYGRSAKTLGREVGDIVDDFLHVAADCVVRGRRLCIAFPKGVRIAQLAEDSGFKVVESHYVYVHRSLTREVAVLERA